MQTQCAIGLCLAAGYSNGSFINASNDMCTGTYFSGSEWYYNTYTDSTVHHETLLESAQISAECYNTEQEMAADVQMSDSAFWKLPPESHCKITNSGRCVENVHKEASFDHCCITARKALRISVGRNIEKTDYSTYFTLREEDIYDSVKLDREILDGGETLFWRKSSYTHQSWRICAVHNSNILSEGLYMCVFFVPCAKFDVI